MDVEMTTICLFHPVLWDGHKHIYPSLTVGSQIFFFSILLLQEVVLVAEQGRKCCKSIQYPRQMFKIYQPPGLMREQAFSSSPQVTETFPLPCLKQYYFAWFCKTPFMAKVACNTSFWRWVQCLIWSTAVIWLQCSWRLSMPEMLEGIVIFCVIIWIGLPKSWNWAWGSVRLARAFISCWGTEFQRDWWELVGLDVFSALYPHPFQDRYCAIIPLLIQLSKIENKFTPLFFYLKLHEPWSETLQWHKKLPRAGGLEHELGLLTHS